MAVTFTQDDVNKVAAVLAAEKTTFEKDHYRLRVVNAEDKRILVLEVYPEVDLGRTRGMLVVVYTGNSHMQLHNCTGYVVSEELGEVTFVAESKQRLSGLVVERGASCSLYAELNRGLISSDFTKLGIEVMLSGVALSLAEEILGQGKGTDEE